MKEFCGTNIESEDYNKITQAVESGKWKSVYAFLQEAVDEKLIKEGMKQA